MMWISVRNWRKFQHYDPAKRIPPWIKNNTELLHDAAYLSLSSHRRGVLHGLWLEYASSRCQLPLDSVSSTSRQRFGTRSLSRRLNLRVTSDDIEALGHAGFIDVVASNVLAEGYQVASTALALARSLETEVETEKEQNPRTSTVTVNYDSPRENGAGHGYGTEQDEEQVRQTIAASLGTTDEEEPF